MRRTLHSKIKMRYTFSARIAVSKPKRANCTPPHHAATKQTATDVQELLGYWNWFVEGLKPYHEVITAISTAVLAVFTIILARIARRQIKDSRVLQRAYIDALVRMGRQHVRDGVVHVLQQKTGAMLAIPLHPALAAIIEATPSDHLTFLTTSFGKPFTAAGFGNFFRERCNEAGLSADCAAHGLRKAACRRLAEAGCSANVIASISGHTTLTEVSRYTKAADQERMARDGMAAISGTVSGNGDERVAKPGK